MSFADFSQDYPFVFGSAYKDLVPELHAYMEPLQMALLAVAILLSLKSVILRRAPYHFDKGTRLFLTLFPVATALGVAVGLLNGVEPKWVFGDARNVAVYLLVFGIPIRGEGTARLRALGGFTIAPAFIKLALAVVSSIVLTASMDWRYVLKTSGFLPVAALVGFALRAQASNRRTRRRLLMFAMAALIGVFLAQARGILLGTAAGFAVLGLIGFRQRKTWQMAVLVAALAMVIGLAVATSRGDFQTAFGRWTTDDMTVGSDYRLRQVNSLMEMFKKSPLVGVGLGAFDPSYEGHADWLSRPYLVEMEFVNLLAKCGILGCAFIAAAFAALIGACWIKAVRSPVPDERGLMAGLAAGLIALLVESSVQTMYSSILFHLYVVFVLLSLSATYRRRPQAAESAVATTEPMLA